MSRNQSAKPGILIKLLFGVNVILGLSLIGAYLSTHISPNTMPQLSFLGLAYPLLLIVLALFSVVWLFIKRKYLVFNIVIFLLGWNHFTNFYAFNNSSTTHSANDLKVLSYNVRIFNYYDTQNRVNTRNDIFNFLEEEAADVYCFQEFYHQEEGFKTRDTIIEFLKTKNYHERYTHEMTGEKFFGVATFSKFPIINRGGISFENDANNYCIYTDILKDRDTIRIFNAHLGSIRLQDGDYALFGENGSGGVYEGDVHEQKIYDRLKIAFQKRAVQIEQVMVEVEKSPYPIIFCGDLNDTPVSYCYRQISNDLIDSFLESSNGVGTTYIGDLPSNRIDYIFHSAELESREFETHDVHFSDHKPISSYIGNVFDN